MSVAPHDDDDDDDDDAVVVAAAAGFIICHRKAMMAADTFSPLSLSLSVDFVTPSGGCVK